MRKAFSYFKIPTVHLPDPPPAPRDENGLTLGDRLRRGMPGIRIRHGLKGDCADYREDLARPRSEFMADPETPAGWDPRRGDPEAYVDGPRAVQRLIDKRKRQGWRTHGKPDDLEREIPRGDLPDAGEADTHESLTECFESAVKEVRDEN